MTQTSLPSQRPPKPDRLLETLSQKQVPSLPSGAIYLLNSLSDENINIVQTARIVGQFPAIAGRLIALANSAWSSPVSTISSLDAACSRLGFSVVRSTSIALAVAAPFNASRCPNFSMEWFWSDSLMTAEAASLLTEEASLVDGIGPSTARTAGLLHNLGLLWLADQLPDDVDQALSIVKESQSSSIRQALSTLLGFNHSEAGGYLGRAWNLPEPLVTAMAHHAEPEYKEPHWETASLIGVAASIVVAVRQDQDWPERKISVERLGINPSAAEKVFLQIKPQYERILDLAKTLFG